MNLSIKAFDAGNVADISGREKEQLGAQNHKKSIFGGDLSIANDPVAQKRKEAQEKAWNIVKNAWENDTSVDDAMQARREHYAEMEALRKEATESLADVNDDKEVLRELYDVDVDSQEQKDLELLEKEQDYKKGVSHDAPTKEELERLAELHQKPLTEYQERALALNDRAGDYKLQIADANRRMQDDTSDLYRIRQERLKSNPMLEAQEAAEAVMEAANEEIIGMLVQEAKDHVDETMEENEEKAKKTAEEQEEKEEQLDEIKLKRAVQEALIEGTKEAVERAKAIERQSEAPDLEVTERVDIAKGSDVSKDVGQSLDEIKSSMNLLEADLKGIKVDEEV